MGIISKTVKRLFYSKKEKRHELVGPPKLWKMKQQFQISFLKNNGLLPSHKLMDIGCGTLRGGIPIIDYLETGNYYGIDVRQKALDEGLLELKEENLEKKNPILRQFGSFDDLRFDAKFDYLFAFSVLIHMSDDISEACIKFVSEHIEEQGQFLANVNYGNRKDGNWQGYPIVFRSLTFYEALASKYGMNVEELGTIKELGHDSNNEVADSQIMLRFTK